uniref:Hyaluronan/mRNA-binding protein domain-containing protein n=1 Tax=Noccaea caerulescens TaxID=107243 RepID=A0A1J3GPI9_NOCCA
MTTTNPFGLLDDDSEDINLLVKAKPLKVEKTAPVQPGQAVTEAKNGSVGGRRGGRRDGGGFNRGRDGGGYNRDSRNSGAPANGNGGYRRSEEGDGARRGGHVGGNRRGVFSNGDSGDFERPRRNFDRHSGTGHGNEFKRDGDGRRNRRETTEDETPPVNGESATVVEKDLPAGGEGEATDANEEKPVKVRVEKEPEIKLFTLEEYEKVLEEKKKALQATKVEERKVDTKAFDSMQQLSSKKSSNDDVFIKLGTEKDKRTVEREEKIKKSLSINEFLKPAKGERYRGGYRGGSGGRGPREGGDQRNGDQRNGGGNQKNGEAAAPKIAAPKIPAPKIEDTAQFPTLGK